MVLFRGLTKEGFVLCFNSFIDCKTTRSFAKIFERVLTRGRETGERGEEGVAQPGQKGNGERGQSNSFIDMSKNDL